MWTRGRLGGAARVLYFCKDDEMALVELDKESTLFKAEWQVVLLIKKKKKQTTMMIKEKKMLQTSQKRLFFLLICHF